MAWWKAGWGVAEANYWITIVLNKGRLKRKLTEYVRYYHEDRTHLGPEEETRPVNKRRHQGRVFTLSLERGLAAFITGTILQPDCSA
jgi:hypothetical protein